MTKKMTLMLAVVCALLALSASSAFAAASSNSPHGKKYTICGTYSYEGEPEQSCFPEELFQRTKTFDVEAGSYGNHSGTYIRQGKNYTFTAGQGECVLHGVKGKHGVISGTFSCEAEEETFTGNFTMTPKS